MTKNILYFALVFSVAIISCNPKEPPQLISIGDDNLYELIADTIITDVVILSPDGDEWTDYTLRNLNKEILVNNIFEAVYNDELTPFEFFKNTPLNIEDIKELEKDPEFSREKIAKVQFEEAWYYDSDSQKMIKKVHSIMLAYEIYNSDGELKGYKPAFKVYFNH